MLNDINKILLSLFKNKEEYEKNFNDTTINNNQG